MPMQELVGRLTALDPDASESLKVITYFDALVSAGAGTDALLRAASVLAGVPAGVRVGERIIRRDPDGRRLVGEAPVCRPRREVPGGDVWLERGEDHHANDEMVIERLALAVSLAESKRHPEAALGIAVDRASSRAERAGAVARLRIGLSERVRAVALPGEAAIPGSFPVPTADDMLRVALDDGTVDPPRPAGLGTWVTPDRLPDSWDAAVSALRLTDSRHPVVDATDLGVLLLAIEAFDPESPPDDVKVLLALDMRTREVLDALVSADSIRRASAALGMHHSTLQARHEALTHDLGYDPRSAQGRARYVAAELLARVATHGRRRPSEESAGVLTRPADPAETALPATRARARRRR